MMSICRATRGRGATETPRAGRPGFTLIELLVVVSMIALLVAILLPALGSARATSRSIVCLSNVRQMGVAAVMYRNDYDDYVPGLYAVAPDGFQRAFPYRLAEYLGNSPQTHPTSTPANLRLTVNYDTETHPRHLFFCPSEELTTGPALALLAPEERRAWRFGPSWDSTVATYSGLTWLGNNHTNTADEVRLKRFIPEPSNTGHYIDGGREPRWDHSFFVGFGFVRPRHPNESANLVFVDGHARNITRTELIDKLAPQDRVFFGRFGFGAF